MKFILPPVIKVKLMVEAPKVYPSLDVEGKKRGPGRGCAAKDSPAVVAMVGREQGQVILEVVPDVKRENLEPVMTKAIAPGSTVYTDTAKCYNFLGEVGYHYERVNHSEREYVRGEVHENRTETIWSFALGF